MFNVREMFRLPTLRRVALAFATIASSTALASEVRGTLQGFDALHPSPPPDLAGRRLSYWEEPNGAIDTRHPHANPEFDVALIVTGDGVAEMSRPVPVPVMGGRCKPGTVVVAPNGVLTVQNQDWFPRQFFAAATGSPTTPIGSFQPDLTQPRSERQVQIAEAGTYELHDQLDPLFRCWIVVGPGQGKIFTAGADGSFHLGPLPDGTYTYAVYFEGRKLTEQNATIAHERDTTVPALNLAAPPPATPPAAPAAAGAAPAANAAPATPPPAEHHHHHGGH